MERRTKLTQQDSRLARSLNMHNKTLRRLETKTIIVFLESQKMQTIMILKKHTESWLETGIQIDTVKLTKKQKLKLRKSSRKLTKRWQSSQIPKNESSTTWEWAETTLTKVVACQTSVEWVVCQVVSPLEVLVWVVVVKEAWLLILMRFSKCSWANKCKVVVAVEVIHSQVLWEEEDEEEVHEDQDVAVPIHSQVSVKAIPLLASTKVLVDEEDGEVGEARPFSSICELSSIYNFF